MPWMQVWVDDPKEMAYRTELTIETTNKTRLNLENIAKLVTGEKDLEFYRRNSPRDVHNVFRDLFVEERDHHYKNEITARNSKYVTLPEELAAMAYSYILNSDVCEELVSIVRDAAYDGRQVDLDYERKTIKRRLEDEIDERLEMEGYTDEAVQKAKDAKREVRDEFYGFSKFECALKRLIIIRLVQNGVPVKGTTLPISECSVSAIFPECRKYQTMAVADETLDQERD